LFGQKVVMGEPIECDLSITSNTLTIIPRADKTAAN
jgi:hypothetical protein